MSPPICATDASGNIFVSGLASSAFFPVTAGHLIGSVPSQLTSDLFLAKFSRTGKLGFITLVGGSSRVLPSPCLSTGIDWVGAEWKRDGKTKQAYCFEVGDGELFAFAGLWDAWRDAKG
jgi:hypothetical protein